MKKIIYILLITVVSVISFSSCRGGSAKKAVEIAKKYSNKIFKSSEKNALILRHGDDVFRHLEIQKLNCTECGGDGETWSGTCDACSGDGYVFKIKIK